MGKVISDINGILMTSVDNINFLSYLDLFAETRNKEHKVDREIEEIANKGDQQLHFLFDVLSVACIKQTHIMWTPSDISLISKIFLLRLL